MEKTGFVYYQEEDMWVGWLEEYPDYRTQGKTLAELKENLRDIYEDLSTGKIPLIGWLSAGRAGSNLPPSMGKGVDSVLPIVEGRDGAMVWDSAPLPYTPPSAHIPPRRDNNL